MLGLDFYCFHGYKEWRVRCYLIKHLPHLRLLHWSSSKGGLFLQKGHLCRPRIFKVMGIQCSQLRLPRNPHSKSQDPIPSLLGLCPWHRRHDGTKNSTFSEAPLLLELNSETSFFLPLATRCERSPRRPSGFHKFVINQPKPGILPLSVL